MTKSIIATTYDLLTFHENGNDGLFDRCFEKACEYLSVVMDSQQKKKRRHIAFHYLRSTGYVDVVRSESKWSLSPAALVQCKETKFVLIGSSIDHEALRSIAPRDHLLENHSAESNFDLPTGVSLFPNTLELCTSATEAKRLAEKIGVHFSHDHQDRLFKYLPHLVSVLDATLILVDSHQPIFEAHSASLFRLENKCWEQYAEMKPHSPGLYRYDLKYAAPQYYLAAEQPGGGLDVFRIQDREWALICLYAKLNKKLPIRYSIQGDTLSIPRGDFEELRMPTLLERCFRSGTLESPTVDRQWFTYSNIRYGNLWQLMAKFPVLALELL